MKKILFTQNLVYPIRSPFFEKLHRSKKNYIKVFFLSNTASNRKWKINKKEIRYPHKILNNIRIPTKIAALEIIFNPFLLINYFRNDHDILISIGWANPANYLLIFLSILRNKPYYLWVESTLNESSLQRKLMRVVIKYIIKKAEACIVPGAASKKYVQSYVKSKKIIIIPNAIQNNLFSKNNKRGKLPVVLYVGRFSPEKNLNVLLESIKYLEDKLKFEVWLIGYGKQENEIKEFIKENKIKSVKRIEYRNRKELAKIYSQSDIFVLPSLSEPWGFVVNEAMAAGLPILVSNKVGSSLDLVEDGVNGFKFDPRNYKDLSKKISLLIKDRQLRKKMSANSKIKIKKYTIDNMVKIFNKNF